MRGLESSNKLDPSTEEIIIVNYEERLKRIGIPSLKLRKARGDMIETYKILSGKENVISDQFFKKSENQYGLQGHTMKIK